MTEPPASTEEVAAQVKVALAAADLSAFARLLDPGVRWGPPGDPSPPCQSREQVLAWYRRGRQDGLGAEVTGVEVLGDQILVGMVVSGSQTARARGGRAIRWQVLTVRNGLVTDIVGFEQRSEGLAYAAARQETG